MLRVRELTPDEIEEFLLASRSRGSVVTPAARRTSVPVIYAYHDAWGRAVVTVTPEGRKVAMLRENPRVCVEDDEYDSDGRGSWRSVIAYRDLRKSSPARKSRPRSRCCASGSRAPAGREPSRVRSAQASSSLRIRLEESSAKGRGTLIFGCAGHKSLFGRAKIPGLGMDFGLWRL